MMHATFKPHHFLDFLHEIAENNGVFSEESPSGHVMGYYGNLLAAGKIDTVTFTSGADDPCIPCRKLKDGICTDRFDAATTSRYGTDSKYEYNKSLDLQFSTLLPEIFSFDCERSIDDVYAYLQKNLTPEIILRNWPRDRRVEFTMQGLAIAMDARKSN